MSIFRSFTGYSNADLGVSLLAPNRGETFDTSTTPTLNIVTQDDNDDTVIEGDGNSGTADNESSTDTDQLVFIEDETGATIIDGDTFYLEATFTFTVDGDSTIYTGYSFESDANGTDFVILPPDVPAGVATVAGRDFNPDPNSVDYDALSSGDETISEDTSSSLDLSGDDTILGGADDDVIDGGAGDDTIFGDGTGTNEANPFATQYFEFDTNLSTLADAGFDTSGDNANDPTVEFDGDDLDVNGISLANGGDGETYAVRFETVLNVTTGGVYTFTTSSDDGSQLFIDGDLVVDNDGLHGVVTETGATTLDAGEHSVVIVFFENTVGDSLSSTMSGPDTNALSIDLTTADIFGPSTTNGVAGGDTIDGGDGNDTLYGEGGDDTITVGVGDTATGGADSDTFVLDFDQTSSDGSTAIIVDGSTTEDTGIDYDTLDLTGQSTFKYTEVADADGDSVSGVATYATGETVVFTEIENLIVCFAGGTQIKVGRDVRAVETLKAGDQVVTRDNGLQTIRWVGKRALDAATLQAYPKLRPIRIGAGALGDGMPSQDLIVSPQHRIVVRSKIAVNMFAAQEVFVPAKHLLDLDGVSIAADMDQVTYYHVLCDNHEIIEADGAFAETLYTGSEAMKAMTPEAREEIAFIFGDQPLIGRPLALLAPKGTQAKKLVQRHIKNDRAMYDDIRFGQQNKMPGRTSCDSDALPHVVCNARKTVGQLSQEWDW